MDVQQINSTIISGQLSNSDLESIVSAIKFARSQLTRQKAGTLVIGTHVKFTSSRGSATVYGVVDKVNRKYIHVREINTGRLTAGVWRVPANMLEAA